MPRLAVLHWLPAEMYPPLVNLVRYFARDEGSWEVALFTNGNQHGLPAFCCDGVKIYRGGAPAGMGRWQRLWAYVAWPVLTFFRLWRMQPDVVLYIEPQSALPVYLLGLFRPGLPVFVHHHEYHEPAQFLRPGMRLARLFHFLERRRLFSRAAWVSHTNEVRLKMFLRDCPEVPEHAGRILPNYPPQAWGAIPNRAWEKLSVPHGVPLRLIYVGSVSLRDTYIAEAVRWVGSQPEGSVELHVYAYNLDAETRLFLEGCEENGVYYHAAGIPYDDIPGLLRDFHAGLILYRARTLNYRFNASNKLFEYLACGLDVLFPCTMEGVKPFAREVLNPRVMEVDFEDWSTLDLNRFRTRPSSRLAGTGFSAEGALQALEQEMKEAAGVNH